ncbi:MAG: Clp1/GlmU family protein [Acidobacteriota bacterium]
MDSVEGIDIPPAWQRSAEKIIVGNHRRVIVLGGADSGKSTFCAFLVQRLLDAGFKTTFIDCDVGQKDLGPPACLSSATLKPGHRLEGSGFSGIVADGHYFIGAVAPARHLLPMAVGVRHLVDSARGRFAVINTTGFIHGIGRVLKSYKIESALPDLILGIERSHELKSILTPYRNRQIVRVRPSYLAKSKSPAQRRAAREAAFKRYFQQALPVRLELRRLIFQRSLIFSGTPMDRTGFIHFEKTSEGPLAVGEFSEDIGLKLVRPGFEERLLCGVADTGNHCLGLGVIERIDFEEKTVSLMTPVPERRIRIIQLGNIYLGPEGQEIDRKKVDEVW